jgi:hypothetical protein
MNRFRQICATTLLTILLIGSTTLAGNLPMGATPPPPPPPPEESVIGDMPYGVTSTSTSPDDSVNGDMPFGVTQEIDPVMEFTLGLLQSVLALF